MTLERESLKKKIKKGRYRTKDTYKEKCGVVRKLGARITSAVNNLQDEHRILKRPFIIKGMDYLEQILGESEQLETNFEANYFVDDTGTAG